ncbi:MAG: cell surface protein SprA, partial [Raineya sp.]
GDLDRTFIRTQLRSGDFTSDNFDPFFEKFYNFNRDYGVQWNFTRNLTLTGNAQAQAIVDEPFGDLNAPGSRQVVQENLLKLGRMKDYSQRFGGNYKLPLDKLPLTDWLTADYGYNASYRWTAASLGLEKILGNTMQNNREQTLRSRVDFLKLYNKSKLLKKVNDYQPKPKKKLTKEEREKQKREEAKKKQEEAKKKKQKQEKPEPVVELKDTTQKGKKTKKSKKAKTQKAKDDKAPVNPIVRTIFRTLMSVRSANFNYTLTEGTTLPGIIGNPRYLGLADNWGAPGFGFVLGNQNPNQRFDFVNNGWMVLPPDTSLVQNNPFIHNRTENINLNMIIEPFRDFKITADAKMTRTDNYQEIFRFDTLARNYASLSPYRNGTYQVTTISIGTAFNRDNSINSETFNKFINNLDRYQQQLTQQNPNAISDTSYRRRSQDVLIAAFMDSYIGNGLNNGVSAFPKIPLPNWSVDYTGLAKLPGFKEIFQSISITHRYSSEYRIGNYTSALEYQNTALLQLSNNFGNYVQP